jgi:ATP-dependent RNA helicase DeaD
MQVIDLRSTQPLPRSTPPAKPADSNLFADSTDRESDQFDTAPRRGAADDIHAELSDDYQTIKHPELIRAMEYQMTKITPTTQTDATLPEEPRPDGRPPRRRRRSNRAPRDTEHAAAPQTSAPAAETVDGFAALGLSRAMLSTLEHAKFHTPTDIQRELIPPALEGRDCLGQARTGTGKTAAFTIPILERIHAGDGIQALVLVPTRELAAQVGEHVGMLSPRHPLQTMTVFGGTKINGNLTRLKQPVDILVGTPGRILDLLKRRALSLRDVKIAVLDEVDRMLDIGFRDDIRRIMSYVDQGRQTIFVSATITDEIRRLSRALMRDPVEINVSADHLTVDQVDQHFVGVEPHDKLPVLCRFLKQENPRLAIVFTRTKRGASNVAKKLKQAHVNCAEIHGNLNQARRTRVLSDLRHGKLQVLVATDLASRGLDVMEISHIINYDIPEDSSVYVHRIGRTARMGNHGYALTFVTCEQGGELTDIEMLINRELIRVSPADFTVIPHAITKLPPAPPPPTAVTRYPVRAPAAAPPPPTSTSTPASTSTIAATKPPQTLGGRFPTRRRRR